MPVTHALSGIHLRRYASNRAWDRVCAAVALGQHPSTAHCKSTLPRTNRVPIAYTFYDQQFSSSCGTNIICAHICTT